MKKTPTGRVESSKPNLQPIPLRTPEAERVRAAFRLYPHQQAILDELQKRPVRAAWFPWF